MRQAFFSAVLLLGSATAMSATLSGMTLPDNTQVDGKTLPLNGIGLRSKMMVKVYVAGLYLVHKTADASAIIQSDEPKRMTLQFVRDVSRDQMVDAYTEAFESNAPAAKASLTGEVKSLMAAFEPLKGGDQMTFTYLPGKGTTVAVRGEDKVTIAGLPFAQAMFACWIGPKPPSADFKNGLLGK